MRLIEGQKLKPLVLNRLTLSTTDILSPTIKNLRPSIQTPESTQILSTIFSITRASSLPMLSS